jgi:hypothetical protein
LKGVLDLHLYDANRQAGTKAGGGARYPTRKADAVRNRDVLCIQENVAVVGWKQAGRAGIAIEDAKDEGRSGDKAEARLERHHPARPAPPFSRARRQSLPPHGTLMTPPLSLMKTTMRQRPD